jgi:tetratricopeptide (TPR) repeat protein
MGVAMSTCEKNILPKLSRIASTAVLILFAGIANAAPQDPKESTGYVPPFTPKEVYGSQEIATFVREARKSDPDFCHTAGDAEKAIDLYTKAIEAQPDAPLNAMLTNRIAQLYAFHRSKTFPPNPEKAANWWHKCIASSDSKQLIWMQAHMGMAAALVIV